MTIKVFILLALFINLGSGDVIDSLLSEVGLKRDSLGIEPKGYWNRYPLPQGIPHKLNFFDDLLREPLVSYIYLKTLANAGEKYLKEGERGRGGSLYNLLYFLGVDRKIVGFRNYGPNLNPPPITQNSLKEALTALHFTLSEQVNFSSFGGTYDTLGYYAEMKNFIDSTPYKLRPILAELIFNLLDAYKFILIAFRNVSYKLKDAVYNVWDFPETQSDGEKYYPQFDDMARLLDEHSLYYASLKVSSAAERASSKLRKLKVDSLKLSLETPLGIIMIGGAGCDTFEVDNPFILIDLGGNDLYRGKIGASSPNHPISVVIDIEGDDIYEGDTASIGAGILGVGIVLDVGGNDVYSAKRYGLGMGVFGVGLIADMEGDDRYSMEVAGEGCGFFGIGLLLDRSGDDKYYICGNGEGDGEFGGIGVLVDGSGNDSYVAEPLSSKYDRGDYHSKFVINANNAQGFGGGRRGDGSDGHSWAGGMGALIDLEGDDRYTSGNWSLGVGYWYGIGFFYDGSGDDIYKSCYFTQGSGAHYSIGVFVDEGGDDRHILYETAGAALGFGWDFVDAIFIDGGGDDVYEAKRISLGVAEIRSNVFFIELGGDDKYRVLSKTPSFGAAVWRKNYRMPSKLSPYPSFARNLALFLDLGGEDIYEGVENIPADDTLWFNPKKDSKEFGYGNYGIGLDREGGTIRELEFFRE